MRDALHLLPCLGLFDSTCRGFLVVVIRRRKMVSIFLFQIKEVVVFIF